MFKSSFFWLGQGSNLNPLGQKAENLHRLKRDLDLPIPPGFIISHEVDFSEISNDSLSQAVSSLGGWPVAVRSSGNLEDLDQMSFAGQYQSFLNIGSLSDLRKAIQNCRGSAHSPEVRAYLSRKKTAPDQVRVSVLIQKMVIAQCAGVAFSIHPLSGKEENALIEACQGLGDRLVSGLASPTQFIVELKSGRVLEVNPGGENVSLTGNELGRLTAYLLAIQAYFGKPQDVEWAIDASGKLWILQARPITKVQWRTDVEAFSNADLKDGGVSARVCTPLMFSLYRDASQQSMQSFFEEIRLIPKNSQPETWMVHRYGRVYWNVGAAKKAFSKIPGFDEEKFDQDLGIESRYPETGPIRVPTNLKTILVAIPVAFALEKFYKTQLSLARGFGGGFEKQRQHWLGRAKLWPICTRDEVYSDFIEIIEKFHRHTEESYFRTVSSNSTAQSEFKSFLEKFEKATRESASLVALMGGLTDIVHLKMQRDLLKLYLTAKEKGFQGPEWQEGLCRFLEEQGFHSDAELDLTVPRWSEVPERIRELVQAMLNSRLEPTDPDQTSVSQKRNFQNEMKRVEEILSRSVWRRIGLRRSFYKSLNRARTFLSVREQMREYSTQCYAVVRLAILEAARRLADEGKLQKPDDIFMLHASEIIQLIRDELTAEEAKSHVNFRKQLYQGYREFTAPNEFGEKMAPSSTPDFTSQMGELVLKGVGCSAGSIQGTARVVESLNEIQILQQGDILVTRFTDPSWTPALGLVSGIVTEVGGLLSHAAVISREYGIPAILNLPQATQRIKSGQRIRIDGYRGTVEFVGEQRV